MYKFLLTPKWIALTLVALMLLPAFNALSQWQWSRLHQRQAYNAVIVTNQKLPPAELGDVENSATRTIDPSHQWRLLHLVGHWDQAHQVFVRKQSFESELGFWVITPFVTSAGTIDINRGWAIAGKTAHDSPTVSDPPAGTVEVAARVRILSSTQKPRPADLPTGQVDSINPSQQVTDNSIVTNAYGELVASRPDSGVGLKLIPTPEITEGPHRSYALQWIFFGIMTIIGWVILVRNEAQNLKTADGKDPHIGHPQ